MNSHQSFKRPATMIAALALLLLSSCQVVPSVDDTSADDNQTEEGSSESKQGDSQVAEQVNGDYGDAPDQLNDRYGGTGTAHFPTLLSSNGAHHIDITKVALGQPDDTGLWPNTAEDDAVDPSDPDGVQNIDDPEDASDNDAEDDGLLTFNFTDDQTADLEFVVTAAADSPQETYYLNVLFDWNKDGEWKGSDTNGADEWAVKNYAVPVSAGETLVDVTDPFLTGTVANPVWVRLTLSEQPIDETKFPEGWDGTGAFALGETEDYLLRNQEVLDLDEAGLPGVLFNPFKPRPFPPVGGGGDQSCDYTYYMNATICKGKSLHRLLTIGGFAPDSLTASSDNPDVASVSLNEANVTITGNAEGTTNITIVATQGNCTYTIYLTIRVKDCPKRENVRIDCCSPEQIRRDPSKCKNCHVVGRQFNQTNTHGGGGTIPETSMEGRKTNISKSFVLVRGGGLADVITVYYECDPCPEQTDDLIAMILDHFFSEMDQALFGGDNGVIDDWNEVEDLIAFYDQDFDESTYECATRYFEEILYTEQQPDDVAYTMARCWDDNKCTSLMGASLVTKKECKAFGGKGWGPDSNDCTAL